MNIPHRFIFYGSIAASFPLLVVNAAFVSHPLSRRVNQKTTSKPRDEALSSVKSSYSVLKSSPLFQPEKNDDEEFEGFNPFTPGAKIRSKSGFGVGSTSAKQTPGGLISPRQMKMKELTANLFISISDSTAVQQILESNKEFLLEPFNNDEAILDAESVYDLDMTRDERFVRYGEVMEDRISGAKAPAAKKVLTIMRDFVLSAE